METTCALATAETALAVLGIAWFIAYGIGTPWQIRHENPGRVFTRWWWVSQFFAHGAGAAGGWVAAYILWKLWTTGHEHFDMSYVVLFVIAYLGIAGWLPHIAVQMAAAMAKKGGS